MDATQDASNYQPPPERGEVVSTTHRTAWFRNVKVLRVLAQIAFLLLFFGALYIIGTNLVTNLQASNLALDFEVYKRPFNVAISEGPSLSDPWTWTENTELLGQILWGVFVVALVLNLVASYRQYRRSRLSPVRVSITVALALLVIAAPPAQLSAMLSDLFTQYFFPSSMARAFFTGIVNTLQVTLLSLVACTILGVAAGIGLLSSNFLLRGVSRVFVEIFRNTPLVVQLIFIYRTLTLLLPAPRQSIFAPESLGPFQFGGSLYILNARGFYFARPVATDTATIFIVSLLVGIIVALAVRWWRRRMQERTGQPAYTWRFITVIMLIALVGGWLASGTPYTLNYPELRGPNVQEGMQLTIGFVALFLGLTLYTGAFIADIVRAGIQSVPYGQIEAARSQGLKGGQVLSLIVLPQALRLIIPPLGNQYVNLGKNSSLGLVVSYADTYRIAQIANNESGQAVPFFVGLMVIYLMLSLTLSYLTNLVNRLTRVKTR